MQPYRRRGKLYSSTRGGGRNCWELKKDSVDKMEVCSGFSSSPGEGSFVATHLGRLGGDDRQVRAHEVPLGNPLVCVEPSQDLPAQGLRRQNHGGGTTRPAGKTRAGSSSTFGSW